MELVEGPTLADRIARGPIPMDEALPIARQIAEALEAAHEQGIIHRDLKPANVKVRDDGTVKVLDFGLAKLAAGQAGPEVAQGFSPAVTQSPTMTTPAMMTGVGVILGTAAYMSPEQAKGRAADKRSDIWAFGCVLFEMLTGQRAFGGEDLADTTAAVIRGEPDWKALPQTVAPRIRHLLARCLDKDPRRRLRDIGEAWIQIDRADTPETAAPHGRWTTSQLVAAIAVTAGAALMVAAAVKSVRSSELAGSPGVVRFAVFPPEGSTFSTGNNARFSVSPDGSQIAVSAVTGSRTSIWLQPLNALTAHELPGTSTFQMNGLAGGNPFWSPDSRTVGFFADGKLKRIDVDGSVPQSICDLPGPLQSGNVVSHASWSRNGIVLFANSREIYSVPASGGVPSAVTHAASRQEFHSSPSPLPDGRHFTFVVSNQGNPASLWLGTLDGSAPTRLVDDASQALYAQERLVFIRNGMLMAQSFDSGRNQLIGQPQAIAESARFDNRSPHLSLSETGALVYTTGLTPDRQLLWVDRAGRELTKVGPPAPWGNFDLSPDGTRVVASRGASGLNGDIWMIDLTRGVQTRLTFANDRDGSPVWSPDGQQIAFTRQTGAGGSQAVTLGASGGHETVLFEGPSVILDDWSPDGRYITFNRDPSLMAFPVNGDHTPFPFVQTTNANVDESHFSPDGKWIAYDSNESGIWQSYLTRFPTTGERWQISTNGGADVRWRGDGKELYYLSLDGTMMTVDVRLASPRPTLGEPRVLFQTGIVVNPRQDNFAASLDGQRFLLRRQLVSGGRFPLTVVLNWPAALKK